MHAITLCRMYTLHTLHTYTIINDVWALIPTFDIESDLAPIITSVKVISLKGVRVLLNRIKLCSNL